MLNVTVNKLCDQLIDIHSPLKARRAEGDNEANAKIVLEGAHQPKSSSRVIVSTEYNDTLLKFASIK
jgi:hypothetical protein